MSVLTSIKTVTDYFAADPHMLSEEKMNAIRLNINFMVRYPEFFDDVMESPVTIRYGIPVMAKSRILENEYTLEYLHDTYGKEAIQNYEYEDAFNELAASWRLLKAQLVTVIPYVPLIMTRTVDTITFQPKVGFKTRYGVIETPK